MDKAAPVVGIRTECEQLEVIIVEYYVLSEDGAVGET